jgi:hypothetical protein
MKDIIPMTLYLGFLLLFYSFVLFIILKIL